MHGLSSSFSSLVDQGLLVCGACQTRQSFLGAVLPSAAGQIPDARSTNLELVLPTQPC